MRCTILMGSGVYLDEETTRRVRVFVARVGAAESMRRLGLGKNTLDAARDRGRVAERTRTKLLAALEREELI